jgi:hypothetical protein
MKFKCDNMPNSKKKVILIIFLIILTNAFIGCYGGTAKPYYYKKAYLDIITSPIPNNEFDNDTLYSHLLNKIETNFSFVLERNYNSATHDFGYNSVIYISYNEKIYVGHKNLENSVDEVTFRMEEYNIGAQSSGIFFLSNRSILIESVLMRHSSSNGDYAETKTKALEKAIDLYEYDKEFLDEQTSNIIEIIISIYDVEVVFQEHIPGIRERSGL